MDYELLIVIEPANSVATGVYALPLALPIGTTLETAEAIARLYLGDSYPRHQSVRITRKVGGAPTVTLKTITRAARDIVERAPDPIKPDPAPGGERGGTIRFSAGRFCDRRALYPSSPGVGACAGTVGADGVCSDSMFHSA